MPGVNDLSKHRSDFCCSAVRSDVRMQRFSSRAPPYRASFNSTPISSWICQKRSCPTFWWWIRPNRHLWKCRSLSSSRTYNCLRQEYNHVNPFICVCLFFFSPLRVKEEKSIKVAYELIAFRPDLSQHTPPYFPLSVHFTSRVLSACANERSCAAAFTLTAG